MKEIKIEEALNLENSIFIDVRTQKEYKEDHILNAINIPLFYDEEHSDVGTIYKTKGKEEAIKKGFDYVSYKLKDIYTNVLELSKKYDSILIYCARGGMRSGSVINLLSSVGIKVYKLEGGYKSYRNYVLNYLENIMDTKHFIVIHGLTGVGKTDLIHELTTLDVDGIDLEGIAKNSGSTFGFIGFDEKPPSQKRFESEIFEKLFFSKSDYILIESESKRIGTVSIPNKIYDNIINSKYHLLIESSIENRVSRLCNDYITNKKNKEKLKDCINKFRKRLGNEKVDEYILLLEDNEYEILVEKYLLEYYDPLYMHSVNKYVYNEVINFDNQKECIDKVLEFHKKLKGDEIC